MTPPVESEGKVTKPTPPQPVLSPLTPLGTVEVDELRMKIGPPDRGIPVGNERKYHSGYEVYHK